LKEHPLIVEEGIVAGNAYDKYGTRNPLARAMMNGFLRSFRQMVKDTGAREVHEIGCGEGHLSVRLAQAGLKTRASDFSKQVVDQARQKARAAGVDVSFAATSIYDLNPSDAGAELVVCCEVLEHLPDPERALDILAQLARPHLIVSVPRERQIYGPMGQYPRTFESLVAPFLLALLKPPTGNCGVSFALPLDHGPLPFPRLA